MRRMTPSARSEPTAVGAGCTAPVEDVATNDKDVTDKNASSDPSRLRRMFAEHFDFIWRSLRRFGLTGDRADDAAQQVFLIASRKLDAIREGSEKSFLFGTAMRVASDVRRSAVHRREIAHPNPAEDLEAPDLQPDALLDERRARALLDEVLESMDLDTRSVFVLYELEQMTTLEIASLLEIPQGTAQSRLRRAREEFQSKVTMMKNRIAHQGSTK